MQKPRLKYIVTLLTIAIIVAHLWDSQPWLFHREERIATKLRRAGAKVQLSGHEIVLVSFTNQPATDEELELLTELHGLDTLRMNCDFREDRGYPVETSPCKITDEGLAHLKRLSSIKQLSVNLAGTSVTEVGLMSFRSMENVEHLQINFNSRACTPAGLQSFAPMTELEFLCLSGGGRVSGAWFADFRDDPNHADQRLAAFANAEKLRRVYVSGPMASEAGLRAMLRNKAGLESLYLEGPFVTDASLESLHGLSNLQSLTIIGPVSDEGLRTLASLVGLQSLSVQHNQGRQGLPTITDAGLEHLREMDELETLSVMFSEIEGPGLAALSSLPALTHLSITGSKISDEGLNYLHADSNLRSLIIDFDSITQAAASQLLARFPLLNFGPYGRQVSQ